MRSEQTGEQQNAVRLVLDTNVVATGHMREGATPRLIALTSHGPLRIQIVHDDPDDDVVLATAFAGQAHLIITGDAHLLKLGRFRFIPIVRPISAIAMLGGSPLRRQRRALLPKGEAHPVACDGINTAPSLS